MPPRHKKVNNASLAREASLARRNRLLQDIETLSSSIEAITKNDPNPTEALSQLEELWPKIIKSKGHRRQLRDEKWRIEDEYGKMRAQGMARLLEEVHISTKLKALNRSFQELEVTRKRLDHAFHRYRSARRSEVDTCRTADSASFQRRHLRHRLAPISQQVRCRWDVIRGIQERRMEAMNRNAEYILVPGVTRIVEKIFEAMEKILFDITERLAKAELDLKRLPIAHGSHHAEVGQARAETNRMVAQALKLGQDWEDLSGTAWCFVIT